MTVLNVLIKGISRAFYYENAGVFIIGFLLAFGFLNGTEHQAIAAAIASNNMLCLIVTLLWSLYILKTSMFFLDKLYSPTYRFLWTLSLLPVNVRVFHLITMQALMNLPVSLYALLVLKFSVEAQNNIALVSLCFFLFVSHAIPVMFYLFKLHSYYSIRSSQWTDVGLNVLSAISKPSWCWPIIGSLKSRPALWFLSKPVGMLILIAFSSIDNVEQYNIKWISIGTLIVFSTNLPILFETYSFNEQYLSIFKNLPLTKPQMLLKDSAMILTLLLPEILLLVKTFPTHHHGTDLIGLIVFGFLLNWLCYLGLHLFELNLEDFLRRYFFIFMMLFVIISSGLLFGTVVVILMAIIIFIYTNYYRLILN